MGAVHLRPAAQADLDDIWRYTVETWSQTQAEVYLSGLGAAFDRLAQFPQMARLREEFDPPVRLFPYQQHVIVYLTSEDNIDIIRVLHNRTNWASLLAE